VPNLTQEEKLWLTAHPIIKVGFHATKPPYSFSYDKDDFKGILASYFNHFESLLNTQFKPVSGDSWEELFHMLNEGEIDIIGGFPSHLETPQNLNTTEALFEIPLSLLVSKKSTIFENFEEFLQKRIATTDKKSFTPLLEKHFFKLELIQSDNFQKALKELNTGGFDGLVGEARVIDYYIQSSKKWENYSNYTLPVHYNLQIGIHKDLPLLHSILQKTLSNLTNEQKNRLIVPWIATTAQPFFKIWHLIIAMGMLAVGLMFLAINYRLKISKINKLSYENRLTKSHLEIVTDALNAGSWIWHIAKNQNIINTRYATMLGYQKDEIPPTFDGLMSLVAPEDTTLMLSALKRHIDKVDPFFSVYIKLRHKDGNYRLVQSFGGVLIYNEDGSPKTLGGCHLLAQEEALRTSEVPIDNITGILTHHHYRAFIPLYFKQARQEFSGVMLILFRLGFSEEAADLREEALERFGVALFEHLPAPSGLCFYMGEGIFSSFYWNDDPSDAQVIAQDLHAQLETVITSFSSNIYLHSGTAFMLPGSNVDESNLYQNAYVNLAQKDKTE
jgi:ABC-type amino acid transport substrate-binding protein